MVSTLGLPHLLILLYHVFRTRCGAVFDIDFADLDFDVMCFAAANKRQKCFAAANKRQKKLKHTANGGRRLARAVSMVDMDSVNPNQPEYFPPVYCHGIAMHPITPHRQTATQRVFAEYRDTKPKLWKPNKSVVKSGANSGAKSLLTAFAAAPTGNSDTDSAATQKYASSSSDEESLATQKYSSSEEEFNDALFHSTTTTAEPAREGTAVEPIDLSQLSLSDTSDGAPLRREQPRLFRGRQISQDNPVNSGACMS